MPNHVNLANFFVALKEIGSRRSCRPRVVAVEREHNHAPVAWGEGECIQRHALE